MCWKAKITETAELPLSSKLLHHLLSAISDSLLLVQKIHPALHYNCTTSMYKTLAHTVSCVSEVSTCILHSCALALLSGCSGKLSFSAVYCGQLRIPSNVSTSILVYKLTITIKCMLRLAFCYSKMTIANIIISINIITISVYFLFAAWELSFLLTLYSFLISLQILQKCVKVLPLSTFLDNWQPELKHKMQKPNAVEKYKIQETPTKGVLADPCSAPFLVFWLLLLNPATRV